MRKCFKARSLVNKNTNLCRPYYEKDTTEMAQLS